MKDLDIKNIKEVAARIYGTPAAEQLLKHKYKDTKQSFDQPLPDVIGLKQHDSECASDAIQEVLLFADGIREYTQPIVYGLTAEQVTTRSSLKLEYEDWHPIEEYFHYIQKRFRAHYDVINYIRTHKIDAQDYYDKYDEICLLNPIFKQKQATSIEAGVLALKHYKGETKYSGTGLSYKKVVNIMECLLKSLSVPFSREDGINLDAVGIVVFCNKLTINEEGVEEKNSLGHVVSFFKALGSWVYYDNNLGFISVDDQVIEALKEGTLRIVAYKKMYFVKVDADNKFESAWIDGKWSKTLIKNLYEGDKVFQGVYLYKCNPATCSSVVSKEPEQVETNCTPPEKAKTVEQLTEAMDNFRKCIYANLESNSKIFEDMYKYIYESINVVKKAPDVLEFVQKSIKNIVLRPACSPLTHYWCSKINMELEGRTPNNLKWFKIPKIARIAHRRERVRTPPSFLQKLQEQKQKEEGSPKFTPCLPGQVRNSKTLKCRDRVKKERVSLRSSQIRNRAERKAAKSKIERCPKGEIRNTETGLCVARLGPCPPGQVRDKKTKNCHARMNKNDCPEGQIRDPQTKKCRDAKAYKF